MIQTRFAYNHLFLSLALIPVLFYGGVLFKALVMFYGLWLVLKKDAAALPALAVLITIMSNTYSIYLAFIALSVYHYQTLKLYGIHWLFLVLLGFMPYVIGDTIIRVLSAGMGLGNAIDRYQLYLTMFSFFYGVLIMKSFSRNIYKPMVLSLFFLFFISVSGFFGSVRLIFFIIPFAAAYLGFLVFSNRGSKNLTFMIVSIIIIASSLFLNVSTFTIYSTTLYAFVLSVLYFWKRHRTVKKIIGIWMFLAIFLFMFYTIETYDDQNLTYYTQIERSEITTAQEFRNYFGAKVYEDRAPLWIASFNKIVNDKQWLPPRQRSNIIIATRHGTQVELALGAHNAYLQLFLSYGIIFGALTLLSYIYMAIVAGKSLVLKNTEPLFVVFLSASISIMIIGPLAGIYPLSTSFAGFYLPIIGVGYAVYRKNDEL